MRYIKENPVYVVAMALVHGILYFYLERVFSSEVSFISSHQV